MVSDRPQKKILIVDDARENIDVLRGVLVDYAKMAALTGSQALAIAKSDDPPDLILLDIMMPGMDGYEVCRQLKDDEKTRNIPVIFLTAKSSVEDEIMGFKLGAVDYIIKPISPPVVLARVATHLAMRDAYLRLNQQFAELQEMDRLRKDIEAISRHDLKSPVNGIMGCAKMMIDSTNFSIDDAKQFGHLILDAAYKLREMINLSLNIMKMEQGSYEPTLQPLDLLPVIRRILFDNHDFMSKKKIETTLWINGHHEEQESFIILGDETLCYTMLANLYKNALESSESGKIVRISLDSGKMASIAIHNHGTVPEQIRERFFEKYVTFGKKSGTGLGTYSARLMAETQRGSIHLQSSEEEGTTITITLHTVEGV